MKDKKVLIGKIINTHGIKGELKIFPFSNDVNKFLNYGYFYIDGEDKKFEIENSRVHKNQVLVKLKEFDNINQVERYKNKDIYVYTEDLNELEDSEYLIMDLIGISVIYNDVEIGKVKDIIQNSANDVIVVDGKDNKEIMIPNVDEFVKEIDLKNKRIIVELIKGMI